ncbi:porin family protein [Allomuricauda sp. CAU 1633]|uniref:porin family protein n=1 Tax=Allomuricauda sp. CAU 1633 TaxID=2816036 RepID=UPI001F5D3319|nr:porin family protein [Muricauda sp. CAU 1633]
MSQLFSQAVEEEVSVDSNYLEDQFYIGFGYNVLLNKPTDAVQRNLSFNLQAGFIKDIPLNTRRNFGIGIGLGYAVNSYYSSIVASEVGNAIAYEVRSTSDFNRSKLETHALEIPFEFRWRTSTAEDYSFWRIYAGAKLGYVFSGRSRTVTDAEKMVFSNPDIQDLQYGLILSFGYNTWNVHAYYGLNPLLKEGTSLETGESLDLKVLRIGVIFYIL